MGSVITESGPSEIGPPLWVGPATVAVWIPSILNMLDSPKNKGQRSWSEGSKRATEDGGVHCDMLCHLVLHHVT